MGLFCFYLWQFWVYLPHVYYLLNVKGNNAAALDSVGNGCFIDVAQKKIVPVKPVNPDLFKSGYATARKEKEQLLRSMCLL